MSAKRWGWVVAVATLVGCVPAGRLPLKQVTLFGNGLGYFERQGELDGGVLRLKLREHEIDDVLKTLAVLSDDGAQVGAVAAVRTSKDGATLELTMPSKGRRSLHVGYAAPTPAWTPIYRAILDTKPGQGALQSWAMVSNTSDEDWDGKLVLVTGAPFSLAVDLHTPHFVARPDATGKLVTPTLTEAIVSQSARPGDKDGDGILDENDLCPNEPEDKDGFEDEDGCPDPDNDHDRIPDTKDLCPNEPETYNGFEDEDGCPDRGRVVVTEGRLEILDKIFFTHGSAEIRKQSRPIVDAIIATLQGNPQITLIDVVGHAADDEPDPIGLSTRRAAALVAAIVSGKVERSRLHLSGRGTSQPTSHERNEKGRATNRRVEFTILKRSDGNDQRADSSTNRPMRPTQLADSVAPVQTHIDSGAGVVRYAIESQLRVPRRSASLVAILNAPVQAEEVYLYRPTTAVPGSEFSPMRGAHVVGPKDATLEPGPIAIYARGGFVGDALLDRLYPGQSTMIPFALDRSSVVRHTETTDREPVRIVALERGHATVEDRTVRKTHYEVATGAEAPNKIYLEHRRDPLLTARGLPPGTETTPSALLVQLALKPNDHAELTIEETATARPRDIDLATTDEPDAIALYLTRSGLSPGLRKAVDEALSRRKALMDLEQKAQHADEKMSVAVERRAQLEDNLHSLAKTKGTDALRKELSSKLVDAVKLADATSAISAKLAADVSALRARLDEQLAALSYKADTK